MSMNILLLNAGSSSIKYQVLDMTDERVLATGLIQKIGGAGSTLEHTVGGEEFSLAQDFADHTEALAAMTAMFDAHGPEMSEIRAVGHRTVHGGDRFDHTVLITDEVIQTLVDLSPLAPLHNPPGITAIRAAQAVLPGVPHVAVFDTAFFAHLPAEAYTYAIDRETAQRLKIRRYGFHGTSHNYVSHTVAETLGRPYEDLKMIVLHLGNGASVSAIKDGKPIETSMGLTPLQGLMMGTRSGDIDPGVHAYLYRSGLSMDEIDTLLNKKSGLLGLAGVNDMRDVSDKAATGDPDAQLALDVYVHRLVSYIGSYIALLNGVDAVAFTAGVGENAANIRELVISRLDNLGFHLDPERNAVRSKEPRLISTDDSPVKVLVVPTNEELQMAREVKEVVAG
ncbi:MAG: acetate kinase [Propionibacteriaceae bacterium]|nr:acetate kinase [Propionibacteriaceae bacterium]